MEQSSRFTFFRYITRTLDHNFRTIQVHIKYLHNLPSCYDNLFRLYSYFTTKGVGANKKNIDVEPFTSLVCILFLCICVRVCACVVYVYAWVCI